MKLPLGAALLGLQTDALTTPSNDDSDDSDSDNGVIDAEYVTC